MGLRDKLLDFKRRLSDRHMYSIVITALAVVAGFGIYQYKAKLNYKNYVENEFNRSFFDMVGYVQNVETSLAKALVTSTPQQSAKQLTDVWREANFAQSDLGQLPLTNVELNKTSRFLSQVGDFSYTAAQQTIDGTPLTDKQWKSLEDLHKFSTNLKNSLIALEGEIQQGRLKWGELQSKGPVAFRRAAKNLSEGEIGNIEKQFKEYPSLIYDGPFSEHIENMTPVLLEGKNEITAQQAADIAKRFVGPERVSQISNPENNDGTIKTYRFGITGSTTPNNSAITIDITRKGGYAMNMLNSRPIGNAKLKISEARDIGRKFLDSRGYTGMKDTYYASDNNSATINYAYVQNGTVMYPDLIKVKVALDNGEVVGFESRGFIMSHKTRNLPTAKISEQKARSMINPRLKILSVGTAVIPLESKREVFTYEIKGVVGDRNFLTYINAETGKEEKILIILDTPNGILTM